MTETTRRNGGAVVGILMLETRFPRITGDGGNRDTWPFPVLIKRIAGATPQRVVDEAAAGLLEPFLAGARELVAAGADGITTTCGFLAIHQPELARHAGVPVAASSIVQVPLVQTLIGPDRRVGILTADARKLGPRHLEAAGVPADTPVAGTEDGDILTRVFTDKASEYDYGACEADLVGAGRKMLAAHPEVGALVLECTNMPPFAEGLAAALGLPVYDIYTLVTWFQAGLRPTRFPRHGRVRAQDWQPTTE